MTSKETLATSEASNSRIKDVLAKSRGPLLVGSGLAAGLILGAVFFRGKSDVPDAAPTASSQAAASNRQVRLNDALQQRAGIQVHAVDTQNIADGLSLLGAVDFDESKVADVGGRVAGRIVRFMVELGDDVTEGQPVLQIESPELGAAMGDLLSAKANLLAARTNLTREQGLGRQQLSTARNVEQAQAEASALEAAVRGAEQRLLALGVTDSELRAMERGQAPVRRITLRSPIAGEVVERFALLGQVVDPTNPVVRVGDISSLWVLLDVYERDLHRVHEGDSVEILSESHPEQPFRGRVSYVEATIDERTRTAKVRIEVENPNRVLRPGQFVRAFLSTTEDMHNAIVIPRSAVVQIDGEPSVFVEVEDKVYELRPIRLGDARGQQVEVLAGISAGDRLVTEGGFALKSELLR